MKAICQSFVLTMTVCIDTSSVESFHVGSYEQAATFDMQVDITSQRRIKTIIWKLMDFTFNPESLFYVWVIAKLISKVCVILLTFSNYEPSTKSLPLSKKCTHSELFWSIFSPIRTEYGEIRSISLYSVRMWENADQNNSEHGHFLRSVRHRFFPVNFVQFLEHLRATSSLFWRSNNQSVKKRLYTTKMSF